MSEKHSPLPWGVNAETWEIECRDGVVLAFDCDLVDAEFIVRACNAHEELLTALRDLCDAIPEATLKADPPLEAWWQIALAAIAKAEATHAHKSDL